MRFRIFKIITTLLCILLGAGALVIALFAYQLGMDNNSTPGTMRKILAALGVLLLLAPLLIYWSTKIEKRLNIRRGLHRLFDLKKPDQNNSTGSRSRTWHFFNSNAIFWSVLGVLIVMCCSLWYITNGRMIHFQPYSDYFDKQADGFLAGQTSLLETPAEELANLPDPYDWKARTGIHLIWDASYYNGNYYLYWGPVPALLAALVKAIRPGVVEDQYLLLFFITSLAIVFARLLVYLRKTYFQTTPTWTLTLFVMAGGLSTPIFWLVNRPNVYETAIASCQFFLILGIYAAIRGLNSTSAQGRWLLVSGLALGASVASRTSIVFTVFLIVAVILVMMVNQHSRNKRWIASVLCVLLPLILFAGGLCGYNYVRFGSFFETGMRYQLTGDALPEDLSQLFSLRYIIPNTYLSLLQPYQYTPGQFPFFIATTDNNWTRIISIPENYYFAEQVTGVLCTIPFLWMLIIPIFRLLRAGWHWVKETPNSEVKPSMHPVPQWMWWMLAGAGFVAFLTNMMFVMTTMRYLADFTPLWVIVTCLGVMQAIESARHSKPIRFLLLGALTVTCLVTIVISLFINFTCGDHRMEKGNPRLYEKLVELFQRP